MEEAEQGELVFLPEDDVQESTEEKDAKQQKIEQAANDLLQGISAHTLDTLDRRVGWLLNHFPETRNSDRTLHFRYWETFEPDLWDGDAITREDYYKLTIPTSITRSRGKIQNTYRLFQASEDVRRHRGTLEEEERDKARRAAEAYPVFSVYADESGKTANQFIVGSLWFLEGSESWRLFRAIEKWRDEIGFKDEFHFTEIKADSVPTYKAFVRFFLDQATAVSFKVITVERSGAGPVPSAFGNLFFYLLVRGVQHEIDTGRGPLPRNLQLWKDQEEPGYDKLLLAGIGERLQSASQAQFDERLFVDQLTAVSSEHNVFLQMADLFSGSVNRVLNHPETPASSPKSEFATYFLNALKLDLTKAEKFTDLAVKLSL